MKHVIEIHSLTKNYKSFCAVNQLSLAVKPGEIYGLLGPNGAGKTTAIKMCCGLMCPDSGTVSILEKTIPDKKISSFIGYMPQETAVYNGLTIHQNIEFFGEMYGMTRSQIAEREAELLSFVDLEKWKDKQILQLSGGMQHRTSLACALVHSPRVLFLDEPTVGVDPQLRVTFWNYFNKLKSQDAAILITTHYMDEARRCDRVGFMQNGKLIAEGVPAALMKKTKTSSLDDAFLVFSAGAGSV